MDTTNKLFSNDITSSNAQFGTNCLKRDGSVLFTAAYRSTNGIQEVAVGSSCSPDDDAAKLKHHCQILADRLEGAFLQSGAHMEKQKDEVMQQMNLILQDEGIAPSDSPGDHGGGVSP